MFAPIRTLLIASLLSASHVLSTLVAEEPASYTLTQKDQHSVTVATREAESVDLEMTFCILFSEYAPKLENRPSAIGVGYNVPSWHNPLLKKGSASIQQRSDDLSVGDGFDPSILKGSKDSRTADLFEAAPQVTLTANQSIKTEKGYRFLFPEYPAFTLEATIEVPDPTAPPVLSYRFTPKKDGNYSVGFTGAPAHALAAVDEIWQPLIWQEKRFPPVSYMELAYRCPVPTALVTHQGVTLGIVVDPEAFPFDELPVMENSRFGVAVRNAKGLAQPMTFAPVLGLPGSKMKTNEVFSFKLRPVLVKGKTTTAVEAIATSLYGFRDYRSNAIGSLNQTLENMVDYGMSEWSRFHVEEKGCSYATDAPGSVKNVSSLNPLGMAMITDNEEIFNQRAYPLIEYMLSRGKFLFTTDRKQKIQSPSYTLDGPCAPVSELAVLYNVFGGANSALIELAEKEYEGSRTRNLEAVQSGKTWLNALSLYRMTGKQTYLDSAIKGADQYLQERIAKPQSDFKDPFGGSLFFWTEYNPRFALLLELHELTGEKRYLDAAHEGARRFTQQIWMSPRIPEKDITVHPDGFAPHYWYLKSKGHKPMRAAKETVPAWRLSEIGLTSESSGTSTGHRAIFMANHAPWLIRIGKLTHDPFLRALGRSAIVGRYNNFPGYHMNTARTTVYEKPDYPLRPHEQLGVNSMHYNHIWPMTSMIVDYLVSETMARSDGAIDFPSQFIEGYAYMQSKFYGTQKGRFYDAKDAILWMPKQLLTIDNVEINYIAARGDNALYLALINESEKEVTANITLNDRLLPKGSYPVRMSVNNQAFTSKGSTQGRLQVTIPAKGLAAVMLDDCKIVPRFQEKVMGETKDGAWKQRLLDFKDPMGRAMILNLGKATNKAFIYLIDDATTFQEASLSYDLGNLCCESGKVLMPCETNRDYGVKVIADIDSKTAEVLVDGELKASGLPFLNPIKSIDCFLVKTGDTATGDMFLNPVNLYKGYRVNETFVTCGVGKAPADWNVKDSSVQPFECATKPDIFSLKVTGEALRKIGAWKEKTVFECRYLLPNGIDGVSMNLGGVALERIAPYRSNLWYMAKVIADPKSRTAEVFINGKLLPQKITFPKTEETIHFAGNLWVDDVQAYPWRDYPADYVPEPKPVAASHILGVQSCNLWREGTSYAGWDYVHPYADKRKPYLGWYDEGNPEVTDWEIKWQVEHGIGFEMHCWYRPNNAINHPIKDGVLDQGIIKGLFNARYSHLKKFAIMVTNEGACETNPQDWRENMIPYMIEYFFKDPRYMKIDGKPILSIYHIGNLMRMFNGADGARMAIQTLRDEVAKAGFPGVIVLMELRRADRKTMKQMKAIGVDYCYAYTWGTPDVNVQRKNNIQQRDAGVAENFGVLPSISMGWDREPWGIREGSWTPPDDYRTLLQWTRDEHMPSLPADSLGRKIVMLANWNEFGEGHFLMPSTLAGFGYVDAMREVFAGGGAHEDVVPTEQPKSRFTVLYPK